MQDFFGSVRRSLVYRPTSDEDSPENQPPFPGVLADKITSCIRKSRAFIKPLPSSPPPTTSVEMAPPISWRKGQLIGRGAFGTVYMGMNLDSGELLAVKQVLIAANCASKDKTQAHIQELEEEVKLLKNLSHPNIVRYLGTVREDDTLNILLEFVPGGSISSLLEKFGPFPESVVRTYTKQLLCGLEYLHHHAIMHRDIKGANILVDNKGCIKLADFGASKQVAELATISGAKSMKGTPYWMAPEVILQTGHSFSADIWSVGCTVIEMVTGKAPWSQQYKEVAAIFFIGTTKSHPPIPDNLSSDAKDFLLKCLQEEPNLRPTASELLKHPFVTGKHKESSFTDLGSVMNNASTSPLSQLTNTKSSPDSTCNDAGDMCNLGSLNYSVAYPVKSIQNNNFWQPNDNGGDEDDMCLIDDENFLTFDGKARPTIENNSDLKSCDAISDMSNALNSKSDESPGNGEKETKTNMEVDQTSYSEDDEELTESKIKSFLDEKAEDLKKLQTPLYEEYYNSLITCSPSGMESNLSNSKREDTARGFLKLPPKSRSPSRGPLGGSPSRATDAVSCSKSPGSGSSRESNMNNRGDEASQNGVSARVTDWRGLIVDIELESSSQSVALSEIEKKWKEELDQELERKRHDLA
ncbi:unnamed protein product [Thlaspi arvense]|uniref:mitogen-activated protein kinase kinase kinase n=1 Tax=Thlaspi arvense TaxID=13288 RepID=A0AAU9RCV8_THLAR|nr:unnamed protein product [Thlaspi arvense]